VDQFEARAACWTSAAEAWAQVRAERDKRDADIRRTSQTTPPVNVAEMRPAAGNEPKASQVLNQAGLLRLLEETQRERDQLRQQVAQLVTERDAVRERERLQRELTEQGQNRSADNPLPSDLLELFQRTRRERDQYAREVSLQNDSINEQQAEINSLQDTLEATQLELALATDGTAHECEFKHRAERFQWSLDQVRDELVSLRTENAALAEYAGKLQPALTLAQAEAKGYQRDLMALVNNQAPQPGGPIQLGHALCISTQRLLEARIRELHTAIDVLRDPTGEAGLGRDLP
jgi:chromosome segregation ATPase